MVITTDGVRIGGDGQSSPGVHNEHGTSKGCLSRHSNKEVCRPASGAGRAEAVLTRRHTPAPPRTLQLRLQLTCTTLTRVISAR
ncbi:hypothetical protein J6590_038572 [Homalodisca vitripennis]|nr:hypothetical protein J6590_038572 [Homalodisca vitripennis]